MKRLALLLTLLSFAALADTHVMWQRNHGAWEAVVRVSKDEPFWNFGDFCAVTNGYIAIPASTSTVVKTYAHVTSSFWLGNAGTSSNYLPDTSGPFYYRHTYNLAPDDVAAHTNSLALHADFRAIDGVEWYEKTNVVVSPPGVVTGELPCRFGIPATVTVNLPYTDLLEMLPLDWPDTFIRVRTGFDGYILLRFTEDEMRLTIKRLLPEKLPYERTPRNRRVLLDDVLNGA